MAIYYDKNTQEKIEAECFEKGNLDVFIEFISYECCNFTIYDGKFAEITFPFGYTKKLSILDGDYVIKGREIPETFPDPLHEFHVVKPHDFKILYMKGQ